MRNSFAFLFYLLAFGPAAQAQTLPLINKNVVKINLTDIALQSYVLQYERVLGLHSSIALTVGGMFNAPLPFKQTLLNDFGGNSDAKKAIQTTIFDKQTVTLEYRFYTGKAAPKGFYVAPFARYMHMSVSQDYTFTPSDEILHHAHLNATMDGFGAGVMIGYQFLIARHFAIDWWIIGPFYGLPMTGHFSGVSNPGFQDMSATDHAHLKSDIESVNIPLWKQTATIIDPNQINVDVKGPYYGVRLMGLCFAYTF